MRSGLPCIYVLYFCGMLSTCTMTSAFQISESDLCFDNPTVFITVKRCDLLELIGFVKFLSKKAKEVCSVIIFKVNTKGKNLLLTKNFFIEHP